MEREKEKQNIEEEKSDERFDDSESIPLADDDPSAYKPAPGDKKAKTKPSKHTKKLTGVYIL